MVCAFVVFNIGTRNMANLVQDSSNTCQWTENVLVEVAMKQVDSKSTH